MVPAVFRVFSIPKLTCFPHFCGENCRFNYNISVCLICCSEFSSRTFLMSGFFWDKVLWSVIRGYETVFIETSCITSTVFIWNLKKFEENVLRTLLRRRAPFIYFSSLSITSQTVFVSIFNRKVQKIDIFLVLSH